MIRLFGPGTWQGPGLACGQAVGLSVREARVRGPNPRGLALQPRVVVPSPSEGSSVAMSQESIRSPPPPATSWPRRLPRVTLPSRMAFMVACRHCAFVVFVGQTIFWASGPRACLTSRGIWMPAVLSCVQFDRSVPGAAPLLIPLLHLIGK